MVPIAVVPNPFLQMEKGKYVNLLIMSNNCILILLQTFSFCTFSSHDARPGPSKVIDVTVPVQCQVTDSRLFIIESSEVREPASRVGRGGGYGKGHGFAPTWSRKLCGMIGQSQGPDLNLGHIGGASAFSTPPSP